MNGDQKPHHYFDLVKFYCFLNRRPRTQTSDFADKLEILIIRGLIISSERQNTVGLCTVAKSGSVSLSMTNCHPPTVKFESYLA
jgi:hypothetical protein